jgi:hypothetical protein
MKRVHHFLVTTLFMSLSGLAWACTQTEPLEDMAEEDLGTVEQPVDFESGGEDPGGGGGGGCFVNCDCPLGKHCNGGTCVGTPQFGPRPPIAPCVESCQCANGQTCNVPYGGSYSYCQ